jgi:hypothetical protein
VNSFGVILSVLFNLIEIFMKLKLSVIALALSISACSSMKTGDGTNSNTPIVNQKLSTSFVNEKIKIETKCNWFEFNSGCKLVAIESVGTATTFGNTVNNRKNALTIAEMKANANVSEFLNKEITTNRVSNTIAKNIEKANDKVRSGNLDGNTVELSDQEAKTMSLRENNNDTVVQLTETIRTNSSAILKGFIKIKEEAVGAQEVAVTIRWDLDSESARNQLQRKMQ